jgi:hypothetical protein
MTPSLVLDLPVSQSQNRYQRAHWLSRHRQVLQYRRLIGHQLAELRAADLCPAVWLPITKGDTCPCGLPGSKTPRGPRCGDCDRPAKRRVVITRYGKTLDYGNLVGGAKPLVDALVHEGVLYDDSPTYLADTYLQAEGKPRIVVEVWA